MIALLKNIIKKNLPQANGLQRLYLGLYYLGLWGMNYGMGADIEKNGEKAALGEVKKRIGDKKATILDVGANKGEYTVLLKKLFPNSIIHAFEPIPDLHRTIVKKTDRHEEVNVHQTALGDEIGSMPIHYTAAQSGLTSMVAKRFDGSGEVLQVPIDTIDNFCAANDIDHIHFLKIDVEGFELNVLKGAAAMLREKRIECIQFEFGGTMIDSHTNFRDFFSSLNPTHDIFRILKGGLHPIREYHDHLEIYHYANFVAWLKK